MKAVKTLGNHLKRQRQISEQFIDLQHHTTASHLTRGAVGGSSVLSGCLRPQSTKKDGKQRTASRMNED